jgi:protein-tyrosine phosphatase
MPAHLHLDWPGFDNARDLGGLPTPDGPTPAGRFIRTDAPARIDDTTAARVRNYGVRSVIDLRHIEERAEHVSYFEVNPRPDLKWVAISINSEPGAYGYDGMWRPGDMLLWNKRTLMLGGGYIAQAMREIIVAPDGAVLFHCHAGKDRTGILAQLLLLLAGVSEQDVYDDYMITNERLADRNAQILAAIDDPAQRAFFAHLCSVQPENIEHNLAFYRMTGGAAGYLHGMGLSHAEIDALRLRWRTGARASS